MSENRIEVMATPVTVIPAGEKAIDLSAQANRYVAAQSVGVTHRLERVAAAGTEAVANCHGLMMHATKGTRTVKVARQHLERSTGKPVARRLNAKDPGTRQLEGKKQ